MPRPPRIHYRGAIYHVTFRAMDGAPVFASDAMKLRFLMDLLKVRRRLPFVILSYCIMTNHVHLVIMVDGAPLARIMQRLLTRFSIRYNRLNGRVGHVFQRRYDARLCTSDDYLIALLRYVHRNPVKAGMVRRPEDWRWSSHLDYLGLREGGFVDTSLGLAVFHPDIVRARRLYRKFVDKDVDDRASAPPCDSAPRETSQKARGEAPENVPIDALCAAIALETGIPPDSLRGRSRVRPVVEARRRLAAEALRLGHPPVAVAAFLGRTSSWAAKVDPDAALSS